VARPTAPIGPLATVDSDRERNGRWPLKASIVGGVIVGVIAGLIGLPISPIIGICVAVVIGVFFAITLRRVTPGAPERVIGGVAVEPGVLSRVETVIDRLCASFGVAAPRISVLDDRVLNAAIVGPVGSPVVVVTTGLIKDLSVVELEGVLAHLLAHERLNAVERGSVGAGIALLLGPLGRRPGIAHGLTGKGRLFRADEIAAITIRYPVGLASALAKMSAGPLPVPESFFAGPSFDATRWLFVDPSIARRSRAEEIGDVDATSVRQAALDEW
jgi:Zn-dependent protease with chaperone function